MSKDIIQVPAVFTGFGSRADGGATMRFATNELDADAFAVLKRMHMTFGFVLFRANQFTEADIPPADASDENKSPSQRLRAAIHVYWQQKGGVGDFNTFYRRQMERIIERVKENLD